MVRLKTEWYVRLWFVDKFILNTLEIPVFHSTQGPLWSWAYIFQQLASKMQNGRILLVHFWSSSLYRILSPTALGEIHCYPLIVLPDPQPLQIVLVMGLSSPHLRVIYLVAFSKSMNQLHLSASNADRIEQTFPSWYHCDTSLTGLYHRTHISIPYQNWVECIE